MDPFVGSSHSSGKARSSEARGAGVGRELAGRGSLVDVCFMRGGFLGGFFLGSPI